MDGDTFRMRQKGGPDVVVRLDQIDAPEKSQAWGRRSRQQLSELLGNKEICVVGNKRDKYGRLLGEVHSNGLVVNRRMVKLGAAWAYRQYLKDESLLTLEAEARSAHRGLWSMPAEQTIPPWEFRHPTLAATKQMDRAMEPVMDIASQSSFTSSCAEKPRCRQMRSCEEARSWLTKCGAQGLDGDGDGDGVPCEKQCIPHGTQ